MFGHKAVVISITCLFLASAFICPIEGAQTAKLPSYGKGSYWTYNDIKDRSSTVSPTGSVTVSVTSAEVTHHGYKCYDVNLDRPSTNSVPTLGLTSWQPGDDENVTNTFNKTIEQYYRISDLALVGEKLSYAIGGTRYYIDVFYDPPQSMYNFPLKVGDTWNINQVRRVTYLDPGKTTGTTVNTTLTLSYSVVDTESVSVPAGTFDTVKVKSTLGYGFSTTYWYAPTVGTYVKVQFLPNGWPAIFELKSYSYVPGKSSNSGGLVMDQFTLILIVIVVVIVFAVAAVAVKMRKPAAASPPPVQQSVAPQPQAPVYPQQTQYQQQYQPQYQDPNQYQQTGGQPPQY